MVVVDRVDVVERDEVLDLDGLRLLGIERLELAGLDEHVAVGRQLVALDDVLVGDLVAGRRVDALLLDAHAGLAVELVEAHGLARHRGVELDGDGHQPEGDGTGPDRPGHGCRVCPQRRVPPRQGALHAEERVGASTPYPGSRRQRLRGLRRAGRIDRHVAVGIGLGDARRDRVARRPGSGDGTGSAGTVGGSGTIGPTGSPGTGTFSSAMWTGTCCCARHRTAMGLLRRVRSGYPAYAPPNGVSSRRSRSSAIDSKTAIAPASRSSSTPKPPVRTRSS